MPTSSRLLPRLLGGARPWLQQACTTAEASAASHAVEATCSTSGVTHILLNPTRPSWFPIRSSFFSRQASNDASGSSSSRGSSSRLATWKGPAGQPPPRPPPEVISGQGAGAAAAAEVTGPLTWLGSHQVALGSIPQVPKLLGFAGAIPFVTLTPYVVEAAGLPGYIEQAAKAQVVYGALIVTFLGAVHWGLAMTMSISGPRAAAMLRERYVWSVFPSLAAWPLPFLQPGPGSFCAAMLLGICYLSDKSYYRLGSIPKWYMALRGYLTFLASLSMVSTTTYYWAQTVRQVQELKAREEQEEQEVRRRRAEATLPPPISTPAPATAESTAAPVTGSQPAAKKGWFK